MPWTVIGNIIVAIVPRLIGLLEQRTAAKTGQEKRATVKEIVLATVEGVEGATGRDVFNDPEVSKAFDAMNDAIVAFQNLLSKKNATQPGPVATAP